MSTTSPRVPRYETSKAMQRIVRAIERAGRLTAAEIAKEAFVSLHTLGPGGYLQALQDLEKIHVADWQKACNGFVIAVYAAGVGESAERHLFTDMDRDSAGMARIVASLRLQPDLPYREAAIAAGISPTTVKNARYMEILNEQRRVHISGWRRNNQGPMQALFRAGEGDNVPQPRPYSGAEKSRRYRMRLAVATGRLGLTSLVRQMVRQDHARIS